MDNEELKNFMIYKAGLGLNEGYTFGRSLAGYMRLNAACPRSVLEKALNQLREAVDAIVIVRERGEPGAGLTRAAAIKANYIWREEYG